MRRLVKLVSRKRRPPPLPTTCRPAVGDTRSLVIHPASTPHRQLTDEQRDATGAGNDVSRLSVGIETAADLIADLDQALGQAS